MSTRLLIPVSKFPNLDAVKRFLIAQGHADVRLRAVSNYLGAGPHVILGVPEDLTAQQIANATAAIQNHVTNQPVPSPATFFKLVAPDGSVWRVGVNNAGEVRTARIP